MSLFQSARHLAKQCSNPAPATKKSRKIKDLKVERYARLLSLQILVNTWSTFCQYARIPEPIGVARAAWQSRKACCDRPLRTWLWSRWQAIGQPEIRTEWDPTERPQFRRPCLNDLDQNVGKVHRTARSARLSDADHTI